LKEQKGRRMRVHGEEARRERGEGRGDSAEKRQKLSPV